jgi:hypothetical protein
VLAAVLVEALGLAVDEAEPPEALVAVTVPEDPVVNALGAVAERT